MTRKGSLMSLMIYSMLLSALLAVLCRIFFDGYVPDTRNGRRCPPPDGLNFLLVWGSERRRSYPVPEEEASPALPPSALSPPDGPSAVFLSHLSGSPGP